MQKMNLQTRFFRPGYPLIFHRGASVLAPVIFTIERSISMKKFLIPLLLTTAVLLPAAPCAAEPVGVYVAPRLTTGTVNFKYDKDRELWTAGGALAVGYDFRPTLKVPLRVELEYNKLGDVSATDTASGAGWMEKDKVTVGASTLFVNTYFDWHNRSAFTPYVSLGLGTSFVSVKGKGTDRSAYYSSSYSLDEKTTTHTAWNVGIGNAWRLSETISLDLGYRYANLGNKARSKAEEDDADDYYRIENIETHQFILGAKFLF
jgi:opacity protein-like surface antigen